MTPRQASTLITLGTFRDVARRQISEVFGPEVNLISLPEIMNPLPFLKQFSSSMARKDLFILAYIEVDSGNAVDLMDSKHTFVRSWEIILAGNNFFRQLPIKQKSVRGNCTEGTTRVCGEAIEAFSMKELVTLFGGTC